MGTVEGVGIADLKEKHTKKIQNRNKKFLRIE
jgi:hypothetical protein